LKLLPTVNEAHAGSENEGTLLVSGEVQFVASGPPATGKKGHPLHAATGMHFTFATVEGKEQLKAEVAMTSAAEAQVFAETFGKVLKDLEISTPNVNVSVAGSVVRLKVALTAEEMEALVAIVKAFMAQRQTDK
jgi:hypothetical protein